MRLGQRSGNDGHSSTLIVPELASAGVNMEELPDAVPSSFSSGLSERTRFAKESQRTRKMQFSPGKICLRSNLFKRLKRAVRIMPKHDHGIALNTFLQGPSVLHKLCETGQETQKM